MPGEPTPVHNDHNLGPTINVVTWVFTSLSMVFVTARLYTRIKLIRNPGWDDFWIIISIILLIAYAALSSKAVAEGNGQHTYNLTLPRLMQALRWNSLAFPPGIIALATPKLAVVALLQRLLRPSKLHLAFLWTLSACLMIVITAIPIILWVQCSPHDAIWNITLQPTAKCLPPRMLVNVSIPGGALSAFTDFYLAVYPIIVVFKLKMSLKEKIGLAMVLSMGLLACMIAIYKTTTLPLLYDHSDYTYATAKIAIWTCIEANIIVIAACIPTLRPLYLLAIGQSPTQLGGSGAKTGAYGRDHGTPGPFSKASRKMHSSKSTDTDIDLIDVESNGSGDLHYKNNASGDITKTISVSVETSLSSDPIRHGGVRNPRHSQVQQHGW